MGFFRSNGLFQMFMWTLLVFLSFFSEQTFNVWLLLWTDIEKAKMMMMMDERRRDHLISSSYCSFACVYVQSMHALSNKTRVEQIATFILFGWVTLIHWTGMDETSLSVCVYFVVLHAIVSYFCSLEIDCSDTIEHEKFNVCYCIVYL